MSEKTRRRHEQQFICALCPKQETGEVPTYANGAAFADHVRAAHPEIPDDAGRVKARQQMVQALDGQDFYANTYHWLLPDDRVLAYQLHTGPRERSW